MSGNSLPADGRRGPLKIGDRVRVASLNMEGVITAISELDAEVQVGNLRIRARLAELEHPRSLVEEPEWGTSKRHPPKNRTFTITANTIPRLPRHGD